MASKLASFLVVATALTAAFTPETPLAAEKVTWDFALYGRPRAITSGMEKLVDYVRERTDGDFTINIHWGTLAQPKEFLDGISIGAFQAAYYAAGFSPGKTPLATVFDLPFLPLSSYDQTVRVFEAFRNYKPQIDEMNRWNAISHMAVVIENLELMGKGTPPKTFLDMGGLKLRANSGFATVVKAMGGVPAPILPPELYGAMERGVVDGATFPLSNFGPYRLHELSKWYTVGMPAATSHAAMVIHQGSYNALPAAYKKLLDEGRAGGYVTQKQTYKEDLEKWVDEYKKAGLTEIRISDAERRQMLDKAAKPIWDAWIAETSAKGIDARAVLDFIIAEANRAAS